MTNRKQKITRQEVLDLVYSIDTSDMWLVSIVFKDKMGFVDNIYCMFSDRYYAEKWFSEFVADGRPYYARCCDEALWNNIEEFVEDLL